MEAPSAPSSRPIGGSRLTAIFLVVFVDLLGFGLILPLLPYYAQEFGASSTLVGLLVASYAAAQLIGAPLLGRLSDRHGRRPILLVSILGTVLGFVLLAVAVPLGTAISDLLFGPGSPARSAIILAILFASRVLDGLTGGNISVAQAYIADVTDESNRAKGLGLIGAAFGLGFIIGPAVGGVLSTYGFAAPAYLAAGLATLNLLAVYLWLPESVTPERRAELTRRPQPAFDFPSLQQAFVRPRVGPLFHIRFLFGMAFSMFQSIFALYAAGAPLDLTPRGTGFVLTYVGVLAVIVQGFLVGRLSQRYADKGLIVLCSGIMAVSLLAWGLAPNLAILLIVMAPLAFAGGILNTVVNSALSKAVYPEEVGGTLGLSASLESLTRTLSPSIGGYLLGQFGVIGPAIFSAGIMGWVVSFAYRRLIANPDPPLTPRTSGPGAAPLQPTLH